MIRRAVPLGLSLLNLSNPLVGVTDTLSKLSHDADEEVAQNAILGLGLIGAGTGPRATPPCLCPFLLPSMTSYASFPGTNNARIAGLLRQLSAYYYKNQHTLFVVRIAQGLLHLGAQAFPSALI